MQLPTHFRQAWRLSLTLLLLFSLVCVFILTKARSETEAEYVERYERERRPNTVSPEKKQTPKPYKKPTKNTLKRVPSPIATYRLKPRMTEQLLGLTTHGTAIFLSETEYTSNDGYIFLWNISKQREVEKTPLTKWTDSYLPQIALNDRVIVTVNRMGPINTPDRRQRWITKLDISNLSTKQRFDAGEQKDVVGLLSLPSHPNHAILQVLKVFPFKEPDGTMNATFGDDRFEWLNLRTGRIDKTLKYRSARGCDLIRFSSDRKVLACLFTHEKFDFIDNEFDRVGVVDILDSTTGEILWHIRGNTKSAVGYPLFFISPTEFISSDRIYNIANKTSRPWKAVTASRRCVSEIPGHPDYAMFLTASGTELWNWKSNRMIQRWPTLISQGRFFFSPDLKYFAWKQNRDVQFWKFDPNWVRASTKPK